MVSFILKYFNGMKWKRRVRSIQHMDWLPEAPKYNSEVEKNTPQKVMHWCPAHGWEPYEGESKPKKIDENSILLELLKGML